MVHIRKNTRVVTFFVVLFFFSRLCRCDCKAHELSMCFAKLSLLAREAKMTNLHVAPDSKPPNRNQVEPNVRNLVNKTRFVFGF